MTGGGTLDIRVLGDPIIRVDALPVVLVGRPLQVLCRLVVADGQVVSANRLHDDIWGTGDCGAVKTTVSRVRRALGSASHAIQSKGDGYVLRRDQVSVDADRFTARVNSATHLRDPQRILAHLEDAMMLWRGDPFGPMHDAPFIAAEVARLAALRDRAIDMRAEALLASGAMPEIIDALTALVSEQPYRETIVVALATALYRAGRQVDALDVLRVNQRQLRRNLGLEPGARITRLEHQILNHDRCLDDKAAHQLSTKTSTTATVEILSRSIVGLVDAGALDEAVQVARRSVEVARGEGPERLVVGELCRLSRLAALAGHHADACATLGEARALARCSGDPEALAQTALAHFALGAGYSGDGALLTDSGEPLLDLKRSSPIRLELLIAIFHQITLSIDTLGADAVLDEARRLVDEIDDSSSGGRVLVAASAQLLDGLRGRTSGTSVIDAQALVDDAVSGGDNGIELAARMSLLRTRMLRGQVDVALSELPDLERVARRSLVPAAVLRSPIVANAIALARGEFDGLEDRILSTADLGQRMGIESAGGSTNIQLLMLWLELGRHEQIFGFLDYARAIDPQGMSWDAVEASVRAGAGEIAPARRLVRQVGDVRPWESLIGWQAVLSAALTAEAAWLCRDSATATAALPFLDRHAGQFVVLGHSTAILGPIDRFRGLAVLATCDAALATRHLSAALDQTVCGGARLWQRWTEADLAATCLGCPDGSSHARNLLDGLRRGDELAGSTRLANYVEQLEAHSATT